MIKHVVITGGTRGIGKGLVTEFLKLGISVSFTGTSEEGVQKTLKQLNSQHVFGYNVDIRDYQEMKKFISLCKQKFGEIDIWINNAGVNHNTDKITKIDKEVIDHIISVNCIGMVYGSQLALQEFEVQKKGALYNFEGLGSDNMKIPGTSLYSSSKKFVRKFTNIIKKEYKNILIGTISPGMVHTDLLDKDSENMNKIIRKLADNVEVVTPFIVNQIIKKKKRIIWLTKSKIIFRFMFR